MKKLLLLIIIISNSLIYATNSEKILRDWIKANNSGSKNEIEIFIQKHYSTEYLKKIKLSSHVQFYSHSYEMYGKLDEIPYKIIKSVENKLVVHLLQSDLTDEDQLRPENIVYIEIEVNKEGKLEKSLGIAALLCKFKE